MLRKEIAEERLNEIMELKGVDEFKMTVKRLHTFLKNRDACSASKATLPNYLLVAKHGGVGVSTIVNMFAEYLYTAQAIEFCGTVKSFEFKLDYIAPENRFSELTRFANTVSGFAGHNLFYRGVACVNVDEWLTHTDEAHFERFLDYVAINSDKWLILFCIHTGNRKLIEALEAALSSYVRLESFSLGFPDPCELVDYVEAKYIQGNGFIFTEDARVLLSETITELTAGKHFNGFKSIAQLANDIVYSLLATDLHGGKRIFAEMLSGFSKNSNYVRRAKTQEGAKKEIGFTERSM